MESQALLARAALLLGCTAYICAGGDETKNTHIYIYNIILIVGKICKQPSLKSAFIDGGCGSLFTPYQDYARHYDVSGVTDPGIMFPILAELTDIITLARRRMWRGHV